MYDPLYTTNHLHQRMVQRAGTSYVSLSQAQDDLSILWPTLLELGEQRRRQGRRGNVTDFATPWADGLMLGNMEKLGGSIELFAPTLIDFSRAVGFKHVFRDFHSSVDRRLMVIVRTYVSGDQLRKIYPPSS